MSTDTATIEANIATWVAHLNEIAPPNYRYALMGKTAANQHYRRVVMDSGSGTFGSVHAFVDDDGKVYKPAGWKAPATIALVLLQLSLPADWRTNGV